MTPAYSVVIPAYNEEKLLPRTLSRLLAAMKGIPEEGEVIVVDNNSTDRTADIARQHGVRVAQEPVNQISRARNAGARAAAGEFLIFLDADTIPTRELFAAALDRLRGGAAGGGAVIELEMDGPATAGHRILPYLSWSLMKLGICGGSFLYCRRDAFADVGGFSEKVYAAEDVFMSRVLKKWGKRHGRRFEVLVDTPIRSSDRKLHMHSPYRMLLYLLGFFLFPWAVRYKSLCRLWYHRPT